jgi:methionyl-tRNA formyltransferase
VRTAYLGTSAFAAAVLERLAASEHRPALVVTRPDRPRGRGRRLAAPPVASAATELGLELFQPDDVNAPEARERIAEAAPDVLIVCAFGALVREGLLDAHEILNVHPSLLPRWRGAAPVERAIMAGDERTGVCIMRLTAGLDSGPVCLRAGEPIAPDDTYGTLAARLERLGADLLLRALSQRPPFAEQDEDGVTYAEKIAPSDRTLDPAAPAEVNQRVVRALSPHIRARVTLADGTFLGVLRARLARDAAAPAASGGAGGPHAETGPCGAGGLRAEGDRLLLGGLELLEVQPPGGRPMDAGAFLRGRGLPPG